MAMSISGDYAKISGRAPHQKQHKRALLYSANAGWRRRRAGGERGAAISARAMAVAGAGDSISGGHMRREVSDESNRKMAK